jgi:hypothetical protein
LVLWTFAKKYWHIAKEIPLMYNGELSHMESSRKWSCINLLFLVGLTLINVANGYFNYFFLHCRAASWENNRDECRNDSDFKPVWYAITETIA